MLKLTFPSYADKISAEGEFMSKISIVSPKGAVQWLKLRKLYRSAFPACERKPFSIIRKMHRRGKTDIWYCEEDNSFVGLVTTINGDDVILVDYFAIAENCRKMGFGSKILQALRNKYSGKGIFLEIESTNVPCENLDERQRRKQFYIKNGMEELGVEANLFGVRMELLGYNCQMNFDAYKAFYRDNYSPWAAEHVTEVQ